MGTIRRDYLRTLGFVAGVIYSISPVVNGAELWPQDNAMSFGASLGFNLKADFSEYGPPRKRDNDPQLGADIGYSRSLVRFGNGKPPFAILGVEAGFGITDLILRGDSSETAVFQSSGYSFGTGGIIIPGPPYGGGPPGPGPIIIDPGPGGPTSGTAVITAANRLEGQLYRLTLGPYLEVALCPRASITVSGGFALAAADLNYSFRQTITSAGLEVTQFNESSDVYWRAGGYAKAVVKVKVVGNWHALAGAGFQNVGCVSQTAGGGSSELFLNKSVFVSVGVGCSF